MATNEDTDADVPDIDEDRVPGLLVKFEVCVEPDEAGAVMDAILLLRNVESVEEVDVRALTVLPLRSALLEKLHEVSQVLWTQSFDEADEDWLIQDEPTEVPKAYRAALATIRKARALLDELRDPMNVP